MRCVSALAALTIIVLGTPAIALASTIDPGSGGPGQVRTVCPPPPGQHVRPRPGHVERHGTRPRDRLVRPFPRGCPPRALTFDMAPGSSTLTEVSLPVLAPPEEFSYHGQIYTIMTVNPGAGSFTVFRDGMLFREPWPRDHTSHWVHGVHTTARSAKMNLTERNVVHLQSLTRHFAVLATRTRD